jgi:hypothetical protein
VWDGVLDGVGDLRGRGSPGEDFGSRTRARRVIYRQNRTMGVFDVIGLARSSWAVVASGHERSIKA